ncbi:hypothetical protein [Candidatus Igneacidithiobacillus taiwanensis]|uniref:hypothetical protein n=1 Tax=Candidatus Igneacidithiobacillus taiwanensis TaxID=1945924 RepID=UPI00289F390D|nr:hypothetical protein [Candidatus Igneacidithiobacillus taiwanensis]
MSIAKTIRTDTHWLGKELCHPKVLGLRATYILLYAISLGIWQNSWVTITLLFFSFYTLAHGAYCFYRTLPKQEGSPARSLGLVRRSAIDLAVGSSVAIGLVVQGNQDLLLLLSASWLAASVIFEFRWLVQNHRAWEKFFFLSLAIYLPLAYVLQFTFVLGRKLEIAGLVSVNLMILAVAGAAALAILAGLSSSARPMLRTLTFSEHG